MVRTFLKVYMELGSYFVSAGTNKKYHRHQLSGRPQEVYCEISVNQYEFFNFGVNKLDSGVNPTNRWYEVDILMV